MWVHKFQNIFNPIHAATPSVPESIKNLSKLEFITVVDKCSREDERVSVFPIRLSICF